MSDHMELLDQAGIPVASHESDLYCQGTPEARAIVRAAGYTFTAFVNQRPPHVGERWLDVSFAYLPWWEARARRVP